jgi:hypothetical protein
MGILNRLKERFILEWFINILGIILTLVSFSLGIYFTYEEAPDNNSALFHATYLADKMKYVAANYGDKCFAIFSIRGIELSGSLFTFEYNVEREVGEDRYTFVDKTPSRFDYDKVSKGKFLVVVNSSKIISSFTLYYYEYGNRAKIDLI